MKTYWTRLTFLLTLALGNCAPIQKENTQLPEFSTTEIPLQEDLSLTTLSGLTSEPANTEEAPMDNSLDNLGTVLPPSGDNQFINLAKQDLADRLKINTDQITFLKSIEITWSDITQGCGPATSQTLLKGKVTGYRIWLQANSENFAYHVGLDGQVFMCPK